MKDSKTANTSEGKADKTLKVKGQSKEMEIDNIDVEDKTKVKHKSKDKRESDSEKMAHSTSKDLTNDEDDDPGVKHTGDNLNEPSEKEEFQDQSDTRNKISSENESKTKKGMSTNNRSTSGDRKSSVISQNDSLHSRKINKEDESKNKEKQTIKTTKNKTKVADNKKSIEKCLSTPESEGESRCDKEKANGKKKDVPLTILDISDVITVSDNEDKEKESDKKAMSDTVVRTKREDDQSSNSGLTSLPRQTTVVKPIPLLKTLPENESKSITEKGKQTDQRTSDRESQLTGMNISAICCWDISNERV